MAKNTNLNTNGFDKNPQNINKKGQPRKLVSSVLLELKAKGIEPVTVSQIKDLYLTFLNLTEEEQKEITEDKKQPAINRIVCKALLSGKGFDAITNLLDRAIGKAQQQIDHTTDGDKIVPTVIQLTPLKSD